MQAYVALLRGINVSGQKKVPMAELRACLESTGLLNVETYIQSGNVFFDVPDEDERDLTDAIEQAIKKTFDFHVPTLVLPQSSFQHVIDHNPFFNDDVDTKKLYVLFLFDALEEDLVLALDEEINMSDEYKIRRPFIYLKYNEGMGKSKMDNNFFERKLQVRATTRNWNTVLKLAGRS